LNSFDRCGFVTVREIIKMIDDDDSFLSRQ